MTSLIFIPLLAVSLSSTLSLLAVILWVAVGFGAVIFVHELGHFLVARACGVKIEKFMIGFDIGGYKLAWRRGETLYGIGIVPLGGYVKMLGQDDDPAHIAEQMKKSQVSSGSDAGVEIVGPKGEKYFVDRRSYLAKSVPQRMAIISAGVVMNVIFAFIFAVIAYGMGVPYYPSIVTETSPGSPAWRRSRDRRRDHSNWRYGRSDLHAASRRSDAGRPGKRDSRCRAVRRKSRGGARHSQARARQRGARHDRPDESAEDVDVVEGSHVRAVRSGARSWCCRRKASSRRAKPSFKPAIRLFGSATCR